MGLQVLQVLEFINSRLTNIEKNIAKLDEKLEFSISLQRNHLIRVKNGEAIDDSMILMGRPYNDLSPVQAKQIIQNDNLDFLVLDVSEENSDLSNLIPDSIHIPLEDLPRRYAELQTKTTPILVISERGVRSILASELLVKKGFFNINNVSGGLEFWKSKRIQLPPSFPTE